MNTKRQSKVKGLNVWQTVEVWLVIWQAREIWQTKINHRYEMTCQHQHEHTPNIHSHRQVARNNENMTTDDIQRDRTQNVEIPHKADQKRNFIKPATFDGIMN